MCCCYDDYVEPDELDVTPGMVRAGVEAIKANGVGDDLSTLVERILEAALDEAYGRNKPKPEDDPAQWADRVFMEYRHTIQFQKLADARRASLTQQADQPNPKRTP